MDKLLLDTNILLDFYFSRNGEDNISAVEKIFEHIQMGDMDTVICIQSLATVSYVMEVNNILPDDIRSYLLFLSDISTIYGGDNATVSHALQNTSIADPEDAIIYQSALENKCTHIISNDALFADQDLVQSPVGYLLM